jgi:hypothetical protein
MAACGEAYENLLRTAAGQRPEDVADAGFGALGDAEYGEWLPVARRIGDLVRARWNTLRRSAAGAPAAAKLQGRIDAYGAELAGLPASSWSAPLTDDAELIGSAISNGREGLCLLELLDAALRATGKEPPPVPGATKPPEKRKGWGILAALGAGLTALLYFGDRDA